MKSLLLITGFVLCALLSIAQNADSLRYLPPGAFGTRDKRGAFDSVLLVPIKNPAKPLSQNAYRAGGIRYDPTLQTLEVFTGIEWVLLEGSGMGATPTNYYSELFNGSSNSFYSTLKIPVPATLNVFVNGVKVPKTAISINNKAVQINAALLSYGTDSGDRVEIIYQSVN